VALEAALRGEVHIAIQFRRPCSHQAGHRQHDGPGGPGGQACRHAAPRLRSCVVNVGARGPALWRGPGPAPRLTPCMLGDASRGAAGV